MRILCYFVLFYTLLNLVQGQYRDEPCRLGRRRRGICSYIEECPAVQKQIERNVYPQICSFEGFDLVICCPRRSNNNITRPPPPTEAPKRKSVLKCEEYTKLAIDISQRPSLTPDVVGGTQATVAEFPHMAALGFGNVNDIQWQCGGSLISEEFVLTAAHCLFSQEYGNVAHVRLGDFNLKSTTDDARPQTFGVARTFRHPDYRPPSQYNDIALVQLNRAAEMNTYVRPACLQTVRDDMSHPDLPIATGWGRLGFIGESSDELMKVSLSYFTNEQCRRTYRNVNLRRLPNSIDDNSQLCAGGITGENKDTCQGDSGGPLQILTSNDPFQYSVIGVTSFGKACGVENNPGVYTRVSYYISWIESIVW